jgi:hypothetical protein
VKRARVFSGLDTVSVLTIDMERGLPAVDVDALMTDADTVYASENRLFVATERWLGADPSRREAADLSATGLHGFATGKEGSTTYVGSGEVPGYLLTSGRSPRRTASCAWRRPTSRRGTRAGTPRARCAPRGARRAARRARPRRGMGKGERIYAVRYIGDAAYVVTFRQTDPLYTIDLSDPRNPRRMGELKVPATRPTCTRSGTGGLLGVGQDADSRGRTLGVQLSLFDVSDLRAPTRLAKHSFERYSYTEVEEDHHAFLWWEPERLPSSRWSRTARTSTRSAASPPRSGSGPRRSSRGARVPPAARGGIRRPVPPIGGGGQPAFCCCPTPASCRRP